MRSVRSSNLLIEYYDRDGGISRDVTVRDKEDDAIPFDRIRSEDIRLIGQAWLDFPRDTGELLPDWNSFRPENFRKVLPKLCVLKVKDWRADDLEFSLYGGHATDYIGGGRPLVMQELRHDPTRVKNYYDIRDRAGRAIDQKAPQYVRKTLSWDGQDFIEYETLMLPFKRNNGVQRILQPVSAWIDDEPRLGKISPKITKARTPKKKNSFFSKFGRTASN